MTTAEREAFDALLKYAQMEEEWLTLGDVEWRRKYANRLDATHHEVGIWQRRFALEKAREVSE